MLVVLPDLDENNLMDHDPQPHELHDRPVHNELVEIMHAVGSVEAFVVSIDKEVKSDENYKANSLQLARMSRLMTHPEDLNRDLPLSQEESAFYIGGLIAIKANEVILGKLNTNTMYKNVNMRYIAAQRVVHSEQLFSHQGLDPVKNRVQIASYLLSQLTDSEGESYMHYQELDLISGWANTLLPGEPQLQAGVMNGYAFIRHAAKAKRAAAAPVVPVISVAEPAAPAAQVQRSRVSVDSNSIQPDTDTQFIEMMKGVEIDEFGIHELENLENFARDIVREFASYLRTYKDITIESDEHADRLMAEAGQYMEAYIEKTFGLKIGDEVICYGNAAVMFYIDDMSRLANMYPIEPNSRVRGRVTAVHVYPVPVEKKMKSFIENYQHFVDTGEKMNVVRRDMRLGVALQLDDTTIFELGGRTVHPGNDEVPTVPIYEFVGSIMKVAKE